MTSAVRFGIIGAGILGRLHADVYQRYPGAEVVAVADVDRGRAEALGRDCEIQGVYGSYQELLADPAVDAVSICTPDFDHVNSALAAASAGKHILCEKPLAMTVADAEAITVAARDAGVTLMVDFHNRVNPLLLDVRSAIARGDLGAISYAYARLSNTTWVPTEMIGWGARSSALWFLACHTVDALRFLLDDEVTRVYAVNRSGVLRSMGVDTTDVHVAIAEFSRGTVATFENTWILPNSEPTVFDFKIDLQGSAGGVRLDASHHGAVTRHVGGKMLYGDVTGSLPVSPRRIGGFMKESVARFADTLIYGDPILATGEDGVAATAVLCAMEESARLGVPIDL